METEHFCTCSDTNCELNPINHELGCDLCIKKCLNEGEIPSCFFKDVSNDLSDVNDYTYKGFSEFLEKNNA